MLRLTTTALTGNFTQNIETTLGIVAFNFLRRTTLTTDKYFVLALDKNLNPHWFSMTSQKKRWAIVNKIRVPQWIRAVEAELSDAILTHTSTC
jgi:hypothetical protein